ncbi:MAG: GTP 3',8-cyclase MoaA [Acidobacteriota bacterium]
MSTGDSAAETPLERPRRTDAGADVVKPQDQLGRPLTDLRISVTDRCNFRCTFCMPAHRTYEFLPRPHILSFEEVIRLAGLFVDLGVRKLRLTGGEPLLRSKIEILIRGLVDIPGVEDVALTSNAALLPKRAASLKEAGLDRVTISLHSLDPKTFGELNGLDFPLDRVLEGIRAAIDADLGPVKLNVVVMKGVNDHEIVDLARYGREVGAVVRFIEYMDVGTVNAWDPEGVVSARQILDTIDAVWPLEAVAAERPEDVASRYRYRDGGGEVGVISSVTRPFCGDCSRARLSAEGQVFTCLFGAVGHDLKTPMRAGESDGALRQRLADLWRLRTDRYSEQRTAALKAGTFVPMKKVEMFRIGG